MRSEPSSFKVDGVLVIDKPRGPTSHDIVARVRRALGIRSVGHAGTLDPMATGVLVLALGEATKLVAWMTAHDKAYEATVRLGVATDTLDADGRVTAEALVGAALHDDLVRASQGAASPVLSAALERERARTMQTPPQFSAIKTGGQRAFSRARRGETTPLAPRPVRVDHLELTACHADPPSLELHLVVSKGYYVRSLARDLAESIGTYAHLTTLRRVRSGPFTLEEASRCDLAGNDLRARVQPVSNVAARVLPVARLTEAGAADARHGRPVRSVDIDATASSPCAWFDPCGAFIAVGAIDPSGNGRVLRGTRP